MKRTNLLVVWLCIFMCMSYAIIGCASGYKMMGYTDEESEILAGKDRGELTKLIDQSRSIFWEIATMITAGIGTIASGFLSKLLMSERKITKAVISGVEDVKENGVKESIQKSAKLLGVENKLNKRVKKLT